jgi:hypothetical protein
LSFELVAGGLEAKSTMGPTIGGVGMDEAQRQVETDRAVRRLVYDRVMTTGRAPLSAEVAAAMVLPPDEVRGAFDRLAAAHVLVLQPASGEILMANPFSAVPTPFVVDAGGVQYWGNCIWDSLGIAAMLGKDARIQTGCGDCNEAMAIDITAGEISEVEGIIHFSVPARRWWDNITFT